MNQILSTSMPMNGKKKNKGGNAIAIGNIIKFFGIAILIFGTLLVGVGVYSMTQNQAQQKEESAEATISIEDKTDNTILLKIISQKNIDRVEYSWNDEEEETLYGNNGKYLEKEIDVPSGSNTLNVLVVDVNGKETTYEKQYEHESDINIEVSGNKIRITYDGDTMISYMTYRWDEEDEKRVEIQDKSIDEEIDALKGLHTLTVVVVDENNNTDTKQQKINGVSKPKVEVSVDEQKEHFVIKASDEDKISKFSFRLNQDDSQEYEMNIEDKEFKELQYILPDSLKLQPGENTIEVTVYNANGVSTETGIIKVVK